jgi:uncharacterized protein (DUF1330 family)
MPAFLIANIEVLDPTTYAEYKRSVESTISAFGGRYLARGGNIERLEGDWLPHRIVLLEFPSVSQASAWWHSDEYAEAKAIRQRSARTDMFIVEGL